MPPELGRGPGCHVRRWLCQKVPWLKWKTSLLETIRMDSNSQGFEGRHFMTYVHMGVSENSDTPKSSILMGFSIINHPFWGTPTFGNTHMFAFTTWWILIWRPFLDQPPSTVSLFAQVLFRYLSSDFWAGPCPPADFAHSLWEAAVFFWNKSGRTLLEFSDGNGMFTQFTKVTECTQFKFTQFTQSFLSLLCLICCSSVFEVLETEAAEVRFLPCLHWPFSSLFILF